MSRVSENQTLNRLLTNIVNNRELVNRYSNEVSTGFKAAEPGDTQVAGTIAQLQSTLERVEDYERRVGLVKGQFVYMDDIFEQAGELIVRAKEIATQAANETNSVVIVRLMVRDANLAIW